MITAQAIINFIYQVTGFKLISKINESFRGMFAYSYKLRGRIV